MPPRFLEARRAPNVPTRSVSSPAPIEIAEAVDKLRAALELLETYGATALVAALKLLSRATEILETAAP